MRVETERLLVRRFAWMDEADLCEYMLQRVHAQYEPHPDFTREKAGELLKSRVESDEMYAIELKEEAKVIGNLYLGRREFNTYELGYILHAGYQGRGYASEASRGRSNGCSGRARTASWPSARRGTRPPGASWKGSACRGRASCAKT